MLAAQKLLKRRAGVVVHRALELGVPEGGELIGAVLRVLAVGVQAESAGHVAELERAEAEAGLAPGPRGTCGGWRRWPLGWRGARPGMARGRGSGGRSRTSSATTGTATAGNSP